MFVRYAFLAVGLAISHANFAERAGAVEMSEAAIAETEQRVRDTLAGNGLSPDPKMRLAHFIAPKLDRDHFVNELERQGIGKRTRRIRLWEEAVEKASIGGDSTVRAGHWAVAVLVGEVDGVSLSERLAHEFFHGLLEPANDIPYRFEEGLVEVLTKEALSTVYIGTADYVAAKAALEALIGATSLQMVSDAYQGKKRARRSIDDAIGQNLAKVRSMLAKDSAFTAKLLSSSSVDEKDRKVINALQDSTSSAWDVLLGLFEAESHAWAADAASWHRKGEGRGINDADLMGYATSMAVGRPYLQLAGFLASGHQHFLDDYNLRMRSLAK